MTYFRNFGPGKINQGVGQQLKALKHRRAFKRYTVALTAIDLATRLKIGRPLVSHKSFEAALEELHVEAQSAGPTVKVLRMNNEFRAAAVRIWDASCDPPIELQPGIPHEHHSIGGIEGFNQTLKCSVFKKLYGWKHLSVQYWVMTYATTL